MTDHLVTAFRHGNWIYSVTAADTADGVRTREAARFAAEANDECALGSTGAKLIAVCSEKISVFGGVLARNELGLWRWSDGTDEPLVRDLFALDSWPSYRTRALNGATFVEMLKRDLYDQGPMGKELRWYLQDYIGGGYPEEAAGERETNESNVEPLPGVAFVPLEDWARRGYAVVGAKWDIGDQPLLTGKAEKLGGNLAMQILQE